MPTSNRRGNRAFSLRFSCPLATALKTIKNLPLVFLKKKEAGYIFWIVTFYFTSGGRLRLGVIEHMQQVELQNNFREQCQSVQEFVCRNILMLRQEQLE